MNKNLLEEYESVIDHLKDHHIRVTPQRQAIIKNLIKSDSHPTAEEIFSSLKTDFSNMSFATVYNTLNLLAEHGLVKSITTKDSPTRFDYNGTEHYHLYCTVCGKIEDLYYPVFQNIDVAIEEESGFLIQSHDLKIRGICPDCQKKNNENTV